MAHFCPDCQITFENRIANCPRCGYGIANDTRPESFYLSQGYVRFNHIQHTANTVRIQDDDILSELKDRYNSYVKNTDPANNPSAAQNFVNEQPRENPPSNDFFASFSNNEIHTPEINTEPEPDPIPAPEFTQAPRIRNYRTPRRRVGGFGRAIARIPRRAIIRFAVLIAVIAIIAVIWNMRFAIFDSIIGFVGSVLPAALIVFGIIYVFLNMLKR